MKLNGRQVTNPEVDGVDLSDYPDFCDAFFSYAEFEDGTPLTDGELEQLGEEYADILSELAHEQVAASADYDFDQDR
jgi:hypothetical protein